LDKLARSVVSVGLMLFIAGCGPSSGTGQTGGPPGPPVGGGGSGDLGETDAATNGGGDDAGGQSMVDAGGGCGLVTCASANAACGPVGDGCGGVLQCGACPTGQLCGGGGTPFHCGGVSACVPRTCAQLSASCGPVGDGCGNVLQCGSCPTGQSCGGGGTPSVCGTGTGMQTNPDGGTMSNCVPRTCAQAGASCGPVADGCGNLLACGNCVSPQTCGGGGTPSVCGGMSLCVPRTCAQANAGCGMVGDGCGNLIDCGGCTLPAICGGAGVPNQCGGGTTTVPCTNLCLSQVTCPGSAKTTVSGTVYAPTNAAMGYGNPDPIYNALVYIPNAPVSAFSTGVSCEQCSATASGSPLVSATTGPDGKFTLTNAPVGATIPLVIQLGRWRRQITIKVTACVDNPLTADQTRLPRNHTEGDIPLIAVVTGSADPIECVLPKIGIDPSEYTNPSGTGRVRLFNGNGATISAATPDASTLWGSPTELAKYDLIISDCQSAPTDASAAWKQNVRDYTSKGGRLYASHYEYTWLYNYAPFSGTATWNADQAYPADLNAYVDTSFPKGVAFSSWLTITHAATTAGRIPVQSVRHDFDGVIAPSQRWLYADPAISPNNPVEYTFNTPVGAAANLQCGRVMFSDFHVNTGGDGFGTYPTECGAASPMTAQEKVLEFMLFDLTSCVTPDVPPPPMCPALTCAAQGYNCGKQGDGCGKAIDCGTCPPGQICGANGHPGQCGGVSCTPRTCAQQNLSCGPAGDGCGNQIDCGACPMGQTCGGGGVPGQCGAVDLGAACVPRTCAQQSIGCGPAGDGCGQLIDCGACPPGQTCGGGGVPGQCGGPSCTPRTCAQANATCGLIGDGCGATVDCGTCAPPESCGGGGIANQCGVLN